MATTSPDDIITPDLVGQFNYVADLRNMAVSIQSALDKRVNGKRGSTSERNAALASTPVYATYFDTTLNRWFIRGTSAWVEAGPNIYRGPTADMNSFPGALNGMRWYNTTTSVLMWRVGSIWRPEGFVANAAERAVAYPNPEQGTTVWRMDLGVTETYYGLYNATTNPTGTTTAGWSSIPVSPNANRAKIVGDTGWYPVGSGPIAVTYAPGISGYADAGPGWAGAQYRLMNGVLYVMGAVVKGSNILNGENIINIPAGFRPGQSLSGSNSQYYTTRGTIVYIGNPVQVTSFGISFPVS